MGPGRDRLAAAGITVGKIEQGGPAFILRLSDPDGNLVVLASAKR